MRPFIPPKDDDVDYNPIIEQEIEDRLFSSQEDLSDMEIHDWDDSDCDDLRLINIG